MKVQSSRRVSRSLSSAVLAAALTLGAAAGPAAAITMPDWLHRGKTTQKPSSGGTWEYGFWNIKIRSYYTVAKCHGSTVVYNEALVRSPDTAKSKKSIAEKSAADYPGADDEYYYRTC